jgi:pantoate--beta-alanine ligase
MEVIREAEAFRKRTAAARADGASVGFVPTMGAFHAGHLALIERARRENDLLALSIFVNPLQFAAGEDFEHYPRNEEQDLAQAEAAGVDAVFAPPKEEMLGAGDLEVTVDPGPLGDLYEGASRSGHFKGVLTVVARLFSLTGPSRAYFGEKDVQQLQLIRRMVRDLAIDVDVAAVPTVREPGGLALSSRNAYLSEEEHDVAGSLFEALADAAERARQGERNAAVLRAEMARTIAAYGMTRLDYAAIVDEESFEEVDTLKNPARALVAARIGATRLIDNLRLEPPS